MQHHHVAACDHFDAAQDCGQPPAGNHHLLLLASVLLRAGIAASEIDILVTTSSVFAPTPSVSSMLINMFKMREDVQVCQHKSVLTRSHACYVTDVNFRFD